MNLEYLGKTTLSAEDLKNNMVKVMVPKCPIDECTHKPEERILVIPGEKWFAYGIKGEFIQDVFPELNAEEREVFITGIHPDCWQRLYGE